MRLQITIFSLYILALFLGWQLALLRRGKVGRSRNDGATKQGNLIAGKMELACKEAIWTYLPLAAVALMMFSFGKPGLFPQWAGWGVVFLQMASTISLWLGLPRVKVIFAISAGLLLVYLWINQLPVFDPLAL